MLKKPDFPDPALRLPLCPEKNTLLPEVRNLKNNPEFH
jgi:hypothetical protein